MDKNKTFQINLKCIFCGSTQFETPHEDYQLEDGEMIKCGNCGKLNDYSSIREVAIEEGTGEVKKYAIDFVENKVKKMFKNWKF